MPSVRAQERLELIIEDDLKHRRPTKEVAEKLRERGFSSLVSPYITWRKWDRHRDLINTWRRTKRFLRRFLTVRPLPLAFVVTLVVLAFHLPSTRPTALAWGEGIRGFFTPDRALPITLAVVAVIVLHRLLRVALEGWEIRHSDDARLIEDSFVTDSGIAIKVPHQVFMEMAKGGGSRLARITYSIHLYEIFPGRTSLAKQDALDHSLRTPRAMRLVEKRLRWMDRKEAAQRR